MRLYVIKADITTLAVDAIVNAANPELLPGGGVCGAIHKAAGPGLERYCSYNNQRIGGVKPGKVAITPAFRLKAQVVIHAVGPIWGTDRDCHELLGCAYDNALLAADILHCRTIAFPCISTGIYSYPADEACQIAVGTCRQFQAKHLTDCIFCVFSDADLALYTKELAS